MAVGLDTNTTSLPGYEYTISPVDGSSITEQSLFYSTVIIIIII
jgi:hypothetical protein